MSASSLLIRADASVAIGTGHIMRCLALAQAWQDAGGRAAFAMSESTAAVQAKLRSESCEILPFSSPAGDPGDLLETIECARRVGAGWIVVDSYQLGADYQRSLKAAGFRVLFLDDYGHAKRYAADLVLNQGLGASAALYSDRERYTRLLLGPKYALLRREFGAWRGWKREISQTCHRLLVMMGGSDPENLTARVLEGLQLAELSGIEATLVVGGSNPRFDQLKQMAYDRSLQVRFLQDASNIGELMAASDFAISAAGSTCWELCMLGLPALLIDVADNQSEVAKELHRRGCAIHIGGRKVTPAQLAWGLRSLIESETLRRSLAQHSRKLVDGSGASRVVSILRCLERLRLRHVTAEDRQLLWEWANDPEVRAASFSSAAIPWETHVEWFAKKVGADQSLMLIAEDGEGTPLGQIRFDIDGRSAEINVSLAKDKRGCGLAVPAIEAAVRELFAERDCERVHAFVKPENIASAKAFERAGFLPAESKTVRGHLALQFVCARD
jgi:UDP-2,4-diacetamido-2,4,6-trideoxy-beta-L-altropyranose hydrolase